MREQGNTVLAIAEFILTVAIGFAAMKLSLDPSRLWPARRKDRAWHR